MTTETVTLGQWTGTLETAANYMDAELRDQVHQEMLSCNHQDFLDEYCRLHLEKFQKPFIIN